MLFEVERTTVLGRPALRVRGELDIATAPRLEQEADALLSAAPSSVVVDLTETTFLDSSGARQLARIARRATRDEVALQIVCPPGNRPVRLVIDLLELHRLVPVVDSAGLASGESGS